MTVPVLTLNVTSPVNQSTDTNPVHVTASASGVIPISQIQVWLNYKEVYHLSGGTLNAYINLPVRNKRALCGSGSRLERSDHESRGNYYREVNAE